MNHDEPHGTHSPHAQLASNQLGTHANQLGAHSEDADPLLVHEESQIELAHPLSERVWDNFKTYMMYPFMIAVAGSFGLSIGYALYDRAAVATSGINFNFINLASLKQRLRWK